VSNSDPETTYKLSSQSEKDVKPRQRMSRVLAASGAAILLAALAMALIAGLFWYPVISAPPSAKRQLEEVAALQTHVLPLVKDHGVTWYLNEGFRGSSIHWSRGNFTTDPSRARQDGDNLFDKETEAAFEQFAQAIRASEVPINRLADAQFADDGTLRSASFQRRDGGIKFVFTYIYSPGAKPPEWSSNLGPVVLTRIGKTDWWFEQSPDD
jgi:hypothetical protein